MYLSAALKTQLEVALNAAYPIKTSFATMVDDADLRNADGIRIQFAMFWTTQPFLDALRTFLDYLEANGQLLQLCHTARRKCPRNPKLQAAVAEIEKFLDPIRGFCPPPDAAFESELEQIVLGGMQLVEAVPWVLRLKECLAPICRVEPQ
ncbi:MAG: effector-associated domain EAD1-containing protein, partial [Planctomycetaceae bacterium]